MTDLLFPVQSNLVVVLEWTITMLAGWQLVGGRVDVAIAQAEGEGWRYSFMIHVQWYENVQHMDMKLKFCVICYANFVSGSS